MDKGDTPKKPRPGGVHAGHRSRMRHRFLVSGLDGFQDHEVLEFLLYYSIPRRDVNETAHLLLDRFGSVQGVLDASEKELCQVPGVGPCTAHFLNIIPELMTQMARQTQRVESFRLETPQDVENYLSNRLRIPLAPGQLLLVLTDRVFTVLATHRYDRFDQLTLLELVDRTTSVEANFCVLIERVDDVTGPPPPGRLEALPGISKHLAAQLTPLWDYLTVDDRGHPPRSYTRRGLLLPY